MEITIPENLLVRLRQLASRRQEPVATIVVERLSAALDEELDNLSIGEQAELRALRYLSDDALLAIASEQMSTANQKHLTQLMERNSQGRLDANEQKMLAYLVEKGDQLLLRKAEAAASLVQRGFADNAANLMAAHG